MLSSRKLCWFAGAFAVALLTTVFSLLYWNRFLAPSGGWTFFYLAEQMLQGRLPYRDIFFVVTPLEIFKLAGIIRLFGDTIAAARIEALIERSVLSLLLYFVMTRFTRPVSAVIASFLGMVVLASDNADALVHYHIDSVFFAVCALACAVAASRPAAYFFCGFFAGCSLLTKQTTGAGVTAALAVVLMLLNWRSMVPFLAGWCVPLAAFIAWLACNHAVGSFAKAAFTTSSSKGSPLAILLRPVLQFPGMFAFGVVITVAALLWIRSQPPNERELPMRTLAIASGLCAVALGTGAIIKAPNVVRGTLENMTILVGFIGSGAIFFECVRRQFTTGLNLREQRIWLASAVAFACSYMLSLSWALFAAMAAPSVPLVAGLAADRLAGSEPKKFWMFSAACMVIIFVSASGKFAEPYSWMSWPEPSVSRATRSPELTKLAGLKISDPTLQITQDIATLIATHTRPGDTLLVFPYFPIFYSLSGLNPPTYGFNHYIDVCPDADCRADAASLANQPPEAIIYMRETPGDWARDEGVFRAGRRSGSHDMAEAIERLLPSYHKLLSASTPGGRSLEVYSKR